MSDSSSEFDADAFLRNASTRPGVYRMLDADGAVLYVGKAKNLRKRLSSYFRRNNLETKTMALVARIRSIETTITASEMEALLLEQSLIKELRPPYNILLRDDKSYPYIWLSKHTFPMLALRRGRRRDGGRYFGPYPGATAVRESIQVMQKVFRLRNCEDSFFSNRSRPCLQYQIGRCSAPCVGVISETEYEQSVRHAVMFLQGKSAELVRELIDRMDASAEALQYEKAAALRDQIAMLNQVQQQQVVVGHQGNVDVIACARRASGACVHTVFVRDGRVLGSRSWYPSDRLDRSAAQLMDEFLPQFYLGGSRREVPPEIFLSSAVEDRDLLESALSDQAGRKVQIRTSIRGKRAGWLRLAQTNAEQSLATHLASRENLQRRFSALAEMLDLPQPPRRLECFDISHTGGEATQASCVVFEGEGPVPAEYRRFGIEGIEAGDDYAAIAQAVERRYRRLLAGEAKIPDILFIDGGRGQLGAALKVLQSLQAPPMMVIGVAKGSSRKAGLERLFVAENGSEIKEISVQPQSGGLHLIQQIRDEAHRFAIGGHRNRRDQRRSRSPLEGIAGVGPARRRGLLRHFGGLQEIRRATVEDLMRAPGISRSLAREVYAHLHGEAPD